MVWPVVPVVERYAELTHSLTHTVSHQLWMNTSTELKQRHSSVNMSSSSSLSSDARLPASSLSSLHNKYTLNKIVKPCSRLSTARGPCLCNISWIQANTLGYRSTTVASITEKNLATMPKTILPSLPQEVMIDVINITRIIEKKTKGPDVLHAWPSG